LPRRFARALVHDRRSASLPLSLKPKDIVMTIKVGDPLPEVTLRLITSDGPRPVTTAEFFKGKKIVLFGLPGFVTHEAAIKAKGVEAIAMTSVNDPFVLSAWAKASGSEGKISFLADGNADFAKAAGLEFDASANGLGIRSKRYSMLVEDGIVKKLNIEDSPGKADLSGAEHLLGQL
jgi:peroxiredoxin